MKLQHRSPIAKVLTHLRHCPHRLLSTLTAAALMIPHLTAPAR